MNGCLKKLLEESPSTQAACISLNKLIKWSENKKMNINSLTQNKNEKVFIQIGESTKHSQEDQVKKQSLSEIIKEQFILLTPVSKREISIFFRLLSVLISAGVPITTALESIEEEIKNQKLKFITNHLIKTIQKGGDFSDGVKKYASVFGESTLGVIQAAETSGHFSKIMARLAKETEESSALTSKIKGAMIYPVSILLILIASFVVIMTMVIPKLVTIFGDKEDLPMQTRILINISDVMINSGQHIALGVALVIFLFISWKNTISGRLQWENFTFSLPVIGTLRKKIILAKFTSSLASLVSAGVPIIKSLDLCSKSVGSEIYKRSLRKVKDKVSKGEKIGENLKKDKHLYPTILSGMISLGEKVAKVDEVSERISSFYEEEVKDLIKGLNSAIEPIVIVVIGVVIGFFVASIMQPIMNIANKVSGG